MDIASIPLPPLPPDQNIRNIQIPPPPPPVQNQNLQIPPPPLPIQNLNFQFSPPHLDQNPRIIQLENINMNYSRMQERLIS